MCFPGGIPWPCVNFRVEEALQKVKQCSRLREWLIRIEVDIRRSHRAIAAVQGGPGDKTPQPSNSLSLPAGSTQEQYPTKASDPSYSIPLPHDVNSALDRPYGPDDLFRDFPDDDVCLEYIKEQIWPKGLAPCLKCGDTRKHYRVSGRKAYACNHCGHHIYPLAGTIFSKSTTPLKTWFYILYLLLSTHGRLSARQIQRETGVTYKTAWRSRGQILNLLQSEISKREDQNSGRNELPRNNQPASGG